MADIDTTKITQLRPIDRTKAERQKAAERKRRSRERHRQSTPPVTPPVTHDRSVAPHTEPVTPVTEPVTERVTHGAVDKAPPKRDGVTISTLTAALALATVSGVFSITGMTAVFTGAFWPVIGMGAALEGGKLSAVAWLGRHGRTASRQLKAGLVSLVGVLMTLNAIGAYGFLAKAHIGHAVAGETAVAGHAAEIESRMSVQSGVVTDLDRRIAQIDGAVEKATSKGHTGSAMALADQQRKTRTELVVQRTSEAKTLAALQVEKAGIEGQRRVVEADLGPVRYLATLIGAGDQDVLRWFILAVSLLLDPAAVLLLLASTRTRS